MRSDIKENIEKINRNVVPVGYKKGNHYIIPESWGDFTISDLVKFVGGAQPPRSEFINQAKEGYVRLIQIRDYKTNDYLTYIPKEMTKKFCDETDVMIGRYGPPIFQILRGIKGAYNVALIKAIPNEKKLSKDYLFYYLQNETLFILIDRLSRRTSGQTGVDLDALNSFPLPLPPVDEQDRILGLIKTWDKAIKLKEKLIEQKKMQKKGLMQKLLTGKVRLPGFEVKWKEVILSKFIQEYEGKSTIPNQFPILTSSRNGLMLQSEYYSNQVTTNDNVGYNIIPQGYITYRSRSDDGKFVFNKNTIVDYGIVSYFYPVFKFTDQVCSDFILELLNYTIERQASSFIVGTAQKVLSLKKLGTFKYLIPVVEEQEAIAKVLNLASKEITLLETELETLKQQKKGLMQLLLTGKVRVKV